MIRLPLCLAVLSVLCVRAEPPAAAVTPPGAAVKVPAQIPDIETFMQIGSASSPYLTEDGRLYFTTSMTGTSQLYRLTGEGWPYQLTFFPNGIGYTSFSHDERTVAVTAVPGGTELYQVYLLDAMTGAARQITAEPDVRFHVPLFSLDDRKIYFGANLDSPADFHIYEQDLASGARRAIHQASGWNAVIDISSDGRSLLIYHATSSLDDDLYRLEIATGQTVHLTPHEGNVKHRAAVFARDPHLVYVVSDGAPGGIPRLAKISGHPPRLGWMFPDDRSPWEIEELLISRDYTTLAWTINEDGWGRLRLWDLETNRAIPFPQLDGIISDVSLPEGRRLAISFNSPTQAPDIWTWEGPTAFGWGRSRESGGLRQRTFSTYAGIDPAWFSPPELIRYKSFDGTEIPAFLYLPAGTRPGPIPFIVDVHGGPEGQFRPYFNRHFQYLLLNGYGLLAPNVRGSSGYGREYLDADNYKNRLNSVKDLAWGVKHLIGEGLTTADQVGVKGASYGGYMTLAALTEYPDLFAAGIDEVGIANFETFLENTASYRREFRTSEYGPAEDVGFLRSISPIHKVDQIEAALLVVHGENDPRVPVGEARQILGALSDRGAPVDSLIFPDEGHGISKLSNRLVFYRRMVEFFDKYLK